MSKKRKLSLPSEEAADADSYLEKYGKNALEAYLQNNASGAQGKKIAETSRICVYLLEKCDVAPLLNYPNILKRTVQALRGRPFAEILIKHGISLNVPVLDNAMTLLHLAAEDNDVDLADFLIKHGADVNARSDIDTTPLHLAAYSGNVDVLELLITKGADQSCRNRDGDTPIVLAVGKVAELEDEMKSTSRKNIDSDLVLHAVEVISRWFDAAHSDKERELIMRMCRHNSYTTVARDMSLTADEVREMWYDTTNKAQEELYAAFDVDGSYWDLEPEDREISDQLDRIEIPILSIILASRFPRRGCSLDDFDE